MRWVETLNLIARSFCPVPESVRAGWGSVFGREVACKCRAALKYQCDGGRGRAPYLKYFAASYLLALGRKTGLSD